MADETKDTGVGNPNKGLLNDDLNIELKDKTIEERLRYDHTATSLHSRILSRLIARRKLSERVMSRRYAAFNQVDEHCRLFIDLSRQAKKGDQTTDPETKEMPWARSIVVPMSYAILQVYLTQLIGIFTKRNPPIEVFGVGSEDIKPAKLMNAAVAHDQIETNYILELFTSLQDAMKYGMGGFNDYWCEEFGYKMDKASKWASPILSMLGLPTKRRVWGKRNEYNRVEAWDPYNFFPDPRVSLSNIQNGEFWGHRVWRGYLEIESQSQRNGGPYFNTNQVRLLSPKPQAIRQRNRFALSQMNLIGSMDERDRGFHAIDSMLVYLIPEEWHLGNGDRPELWHFAWVDDQCIIRAHASEYEHFKANYSAFESNIDTHVFGNQGSIENLDGLQRFMNWCFAQDTDVLTETGWKSFQNLTADDKVATVSADANRQLTFEKPSEFFVYDYDGEMVHLGGDGDRKRFDLLVTPDHRMWVQKRKAKTHRTMVDGNTVRVYDDQWWTDGEFITADKMRPWFRLPNTVSWEGGADDGCLILPAEQSPLGRPGRRYSYPQTSIPYDVLAPFIGWFVSEGSTRGNAVHLVQKVPKHVPELDNLLLNFPRPFRRRQEPTGAVRWMLTDPGLARWLRENCGDGAGNKKLPTIVSRFDRRLLRLLIAAAVKGDGHRYRENLSIYHSTSKQLIDDMQVVALKAGFEASVRPQPRRIKPHHAQAYYLNMVENGDSRQAGGIKRVPYKGKIYCVTNSTHLLVVRRNGRPAVVGNCWNSHIQNQIRWLNNRALYDPSLIEPFDMENPDAALHVRLTSLGQQLIREGKVRISDMYQQMKMGDVTVGLVQSVNQMFDFAMRASGAADQMMGQVTQDKRTLGEVQRVGHEGSMRMAMHASMLDFQGIRPTILRWISNRQQFTSGPMWLRIVGDDTAEFGGDRVQIHPEDLNGNFDYQPKTGPEPPDPGQMAANFLQGLEMLGKNPGIISIPDKNGKILDIQEWVKETIRQMGVKNVNDFYRATGGQPGQQMPGTNISVQPDEQVQQQLQAGNIIPMRQPGEAA